MAIGLLALGLFLLGVGGEALVRGASRLARTLGISALVVGLTVVAFGTSAPELAVGVAAALDGEHDLVMGNVIGSNIANVLLVLGLGASMRAMKVSLNLVRFDVPIMICASAALLLVGYDGVITRYEGAGLVTALVAYVILTYRMSKREGAVVASEYEAAVVRTRDLPVDLLLVAGGVVGLKYGADFIVGGATTLAELFSISKRMIGLTIVAIGTSLPEIATSVVAARREQSDIAIGNIVGSNIFNVLAVIGVTSLVTRVHPSESILLQDGAVMMLAAAAMLPILRTGHIVTRREGAALIVCYMAYLAWTVMRG
jgi:cation:H+ antiporter